MVAHGFKIAQYEQRYADSCTVITSLISCGVMNLFLWGMVLLILLVALAVCSPSSARAVVAKLKRRYRLYLIRRYGNIDYQDFANRLKQHMASKGYKKIEAKLFLCEHKDEVIKRLGTRIANAKLGEPTPLERFF